VLLILVGKGELFIKFMHSLFNLTFKYKIISSYFLQKGIMGNRVMNGNEDFSSLFFLLNIVGICLIRGFSFDDLIILDSCLVIDMFFSKKYE
jgi:hypothetical protein